MENLKEKATRFLNRLETELELTPPLVTVLNYHTVSSDGTIVDIKPEEFARQIQYLAESFQLITLDQVVAHINDESVITKPSVALTFDDGYADLMPNVAPILRKHNIPATVFLMSDRKKVSRDELENNKKLLTTSQVKRLVRFGWSVGSHTATHPDLRSKSIDLVKEITNSKHALEKAIGVSVQYLAYPKGVYTRRAILEAQRAGYKAAFTVSPKYLNTKTKCFEVPRVSVDRTHSMKEFKAFFTNWGRSYLVIKQKIK